MNAVDLLRALISGVWGFFTELHVPGFEDVTFAALFVAALLALIGLKLVFSFLGVSPGGETPRTSSTSKPRISKERKGDTH